MRNKTRLLGTVAVAASICSPAWAQQAPAQPDQEAVTLAEVVVTARKRDERLIDVPMSVSVIGGEQLLDEQIRSVVDFVQSAPGIQLINDGTRERQELVIRGAGSSRLLNTDSPNGIYRNGAYIGGGSFGGRNLSRMDLFDLDRVEILRGPQGALYGRNAMGGSVNIITQAPRFGA